MWIIGCRLDNRTITIGLASDISDFPRLSVTAKFAKILPKITMHLSADCPIKRIRSISSDRWTLLRISEMIKTRDQRWRLFIYRSSMDHKLCRYWNSDETLGLFDSTRLEISYRLINNASPPELKIILRQRANTNKSNVIKRIVYKSNQSTRFNAIRIFTGILDLTREKTLRTRIYTYYFAYMVDSWKRVSRSPQRRNNNYQPFWNS